jgi:hypothetical protein
LLDVSWNRPLEHAIELLDNLPQRAHEFLDGARLAEIELLKRQQPRRFEVPPAWGAEDLLEDGLDCTAVGALPQIGDLGLQQLQLVLAAEEKHEQLGRRFRVRKPPFLRWRRRPSGAGGRSTTKLRVSPRRNTRPRTVTTVPAGYDKFRDHFMTIGDHEGPSVRAAPPLNCSFLVGLAGFEPATS